MILRPVARRECVQGKKETIGCVTHIPERVQPIYPVRTLRKDGAPTWLIGLNAIPS